jgi:hypothetical protein
MSISPFVQNGARDISNPFDLPAYDTMVESPQGASTSGGTISFYQGGTEGTQVAQLTISTAGGNLTIQRTV